MRMSDYEAQGFRVDDAMKRRANRDWAEVQAHKAAAAVVIVTRADEVTADAMVKGAVPRLA